MMKKLLLTVAIIVAATTAANAQWFIGGNVGFGNNKETATFSSSGLPTEKSTETTNYFSIAPKVGYIFNDKWSAGLAVEFFQNTLKVTETDTPDHKNTLSVFGFAPFVRYNTVNWGRFSLAFEGAVEVQSGSYKDEPKSNDSEKLFALGASIVPVLQFNLSKNIMLESYLNFARIGYSHSKITIELLDNEGKHESKNDDFRFGFDADNAFETGSLNVGFIYKF